MRETEAERATEAERERQTESDRNRQRGRVRIVRLIWILHREALMGTEVSDG